MANSDWFKPYDATKDKNSQHYKPPTTPKPTTTPKPPTTNTYKPAATTPKKQEDYYFSSSVPKPSYNTPNYVTSDNSYSGGSYGANSYMELLKKKEQEQKRAAEAAKKAAEDARNASYAAGSKALGLSAEDALRQAYINKTQAQGYLPQQSALMGAGGMTESSLAQLNAGYGNNRASIEAAKIGGLADLESQLQQGLAGDVSEYQNKLGDIGSQSMTAQLAYSQKLEDIARQERYAAEEARAKASTASRAYSGRASGGGGGVNTGNSTVELFSNGQLPATLRPGTEAYANALKSLANSGGLSGTQYDRGGYVGADQLEVENIKYWKSQGYTDEQIAQMLNNSTGKYY